MAEGIKLKLRGHVEEDVEKWLEGHQPSLRTFLAAVLSKIFHII